MNKLEEQLAESPWVSGNQYSEADKEAFMKLGGIAPNVTTHPHTFAWYSVVSHYKWASDIIAKASAGSGK